MGCWHSLNVVLPPKDIPKAVDDLPKLHNMTFHPLVVPDLLDQTVAKHPKTKHRPGYYTGQWHNLWADNYTGDSNRYVMYLDSDLIFSRPFTRDALFDAQGRPYWFHFEWASNFGLKFQKECEELIGSCPYATMSIFPIITTPGVLKKTRDLIMERWPAADFERSLVKWMKTTRGVEHLSQFTLIGNAASTVPDQSHLVPCPWAQGDLCERVLPLAFHKWPYSMSTGHTGMVRGFFNEVFGPAGLPQ